MSPRTRRLAAALAVSAAAAVCAAPAPAAAAPIPGSYIVTLSSGDPVTVANEHARRFGADVDHLYRYSLRGYAAHMSATAAQRVAADSRVQTVVQDQTVAADAQTLPTGIN